MLFQVKEELIFPDPNICYEPHRGLIAVGGDLSVDRLILAYRSGIFPWYHEGDPIMWWSTVPRPVFYPENFKIRKSLAKRIRNSGFTVKIDTDFENTIKSASKIRDMNDEETWILPEIIDAYIELHKRGYAHSFETYDSNGKLVGGLYGVGIGKMFFGESMFAFEKDASKIAFAKLIEFAKKHDFYFIDAQDKSDHIMSLGATVILREQFLYDVMLNNRHKTMVGKWTDLI